MIVLRNGAISKLLHQGLSVIVNKDAIIKNITDGALESVLGGGLGGGVPDVGGDLPLGTNDLAAPAQPQAAAPDAPIGLGTPTF